MANIPITDNTTLLNTLKTKAQALPSKSSGSSGSVDLSGITATAEDILAGKKSVNSSGNEITGTMTNRGAWTASKTSNGDVTIPAGYHNGSGKVTVNVSTTIETGELDTPAVSFDTTSGKFTATAKVKTGGYISASATKTNTYTLTRYLGGTVTPTKNDQTISLSGEYCTGDLIVKGDSNLVSEHIAKGWSIFGVPGSYTGDAGFITGTIEARDSNGNAKDIDYDDNYFYIYCSPDTSTSLSTPKMLMISLDSSDTHKNEAEFCGAYFDVENNNAVILNANVYTGSYAYNVFSSTSATCGTNDSSDCLVTTSVRNGKLCYLIEIKREKAWIAEWDYKYKFVAVW